MPRGTRHELTGLFGGEWPYPSLRVDDGGTWRLDVATRYRHLIGNRVRVTGVRSDFDLLDVEHMEAL